MLARSFRRLATTSLRPCITASSATRTALSTRLTRSLHFDTSIGLTEDQLQYRDVAEQFGVKEFLPHAAEWDVTHHFPKAELKKSADLGFGGIYVRDDVGGSNMSRMDAAVIFEAMAKSDVSTTAFLTIHNMCSWMIDSFGTEEQRQKYLPQLTTLELFASYCLTEPGSGSDAASLKTRATLSDDKKHYLLTGEKAFISGGGHSDLYLVMARTADASSGNSHKGISCFIVPKDAEGISFGANEKKLGWHSQPTAAVILDNCKVPVQNMLGKEGQGFTIAMKGLDGGRINIATTALGGAIQCVNTTIDYIQQRKQFGKSLSEFQSVQFKIADMVTRLHASRHMVQRAAIMLDNKDKDAGAFCAMAKRFATENAYQIIDECLQLHGGYGYLQDYPIERYLRDSRVHRILEGTNEVMQLIIARYQLKD